MKQSKRYHVRECFSDKQFTIAEFDDYFDAFVWMRNNDECTQALRNGTSYLWIIDTWKE